VSTRASALQLGALAASWLLFAASHSLLAGTTLERAFGRHSRLAFNAVALVAVAAVVANGWSTGAHLGVTMPAANWPVAGVDLSLLATALLALAVRRKLGRVQPVVQNAPGTPRAQEVAHV